MAKTKKTKKATVKVEDLAAKQDPKGGDGPTIIEKKSSTTLLQSCATGEHIKEATITVR